MSNSKTILVAAVKLTGGTKDKAVSVAAGEELTKARIKALGISDEELAKITAPEK